MNLTLDARSKSREIEKINREYHKWYSPYLQRDMELLIFGDEGSPVLFFPTRTARFYDYEDWGVVDALHDKIASGKIQLFCLDSIDEESFYCKNIVPKERIKRHNEFEQYLLHELIPFVHQRNDDHELVSAGCSLGAYHAVNLAFRNPLLFKKVIGMSGRYDLTLQMNYFEDLFEGYWDENIYFNMPGQYVHNIQTGEQIAELQRLQIILVIGIKDAFLQNNIELSRSLTDRNITNTLCFQEGEAHKARYWGEVLNRFL